MPRRRRTVMTRLLTRAGYTARPVGGRAWLVQQASATPRRVRRLGPRSLRAHLVYDEAHIRARMHRFQKVVGNLLAAEHLAWMLRELEVNCVLDVGANVGQFARALRRNGYRGRIVSFEPLPHLLEQLEKASADDPDWHVLGYGIGDEEGTAEINVVPGTMSSLLPTSEFGRQWSDRLRQSEVQTIAIRRLDSLLDEVVEGLADPRVFLKLDTQGYDLQALRGCGDRVRDIVGLQSEVACLPIYDGMPRLPEQMLAYEAAGFETSALFPVSRDRPTMRAIEFDLLMLRVSALRGASRRS